MEVDPPSAGTPYLADVRRRLQSRSFVCTQNAQVAVPAFDTWPEGTSEIIARRLLDQGFPLAARLTRFELTKFGMAEYFFVFGLFPSVTLLEFATFAGLARIYAAHHKTVPLPHGLFESVICYPVAVVQELGPGLAEHLRTEAPLAFGDIDHFWMPVVYEIGTGTLHTYEKTPTWGSAYYSGFRRMIREILAPAALAKP
jgi:hypothetical protein